MSERVSEEVSALHGVCNMQSISWIWKLSERGRNLLGWSPRVGVIYIFIRSRFGVSDCLLYMYVDG